MQLICCENIMFRRSIGGSSSLTCKTSPMKRTRLQCCGKFDLGGPVVKSLAVISTGALW